MLDFFPNMPMPLAATMDLQYRLPPPQRIIFTPGILIFIVLALAAAFYFLYKIISKNERNNVRKHIVVFGKTKQAFSNIFSIFKGSPKAPSVCGKCGASVSDANAKVCEFCGALLYRRD